MRMGITNITQSPRTQSPPALCTTNSNVCIYWESSPWKAWTRGVRPHGTWLPANVWQRQLIEVLSKDSPHFSRANSMAGSREAVKEAETGFGSLQLQRIGNRLSGLTLFLRSGEENHSCEQSTGGHQQIGTMTGIKEAMNYLKASVEDFKLNLRKVFDVLYTGLKEIKETSEDTRYISQQLTCQDSCIDDLERNLFQLMGNVDIIKEEVLKMAKMTQCSHCQESPDEGALPMDEVSVHQQAQVMHGLQD